MNKKNQRATFEHEQSGVEEELRAEAERVHRLLSAFEFRGSGLWFRVWGLGFTVYGLGIRVWGLEFGVKASLSKQPSCKAAKHQGIEAPTCSRIKLGWNSGSSTSRAAPRAYL